MTALPPPAPAPARRPGRASRACALAAALLFAGLGWSCSVHVAAQDPEIYFLPQRTLVVGVVLGWAAALCAVVAYGLSRGTLRARLWGALVAAVFIGCVALMGWLAYVDARDYPRINFGFVAGSGVQRLAVLAGVGVALPAAASVTAAALLQARQRARSRASEPPAC